MVDATKVSSIKIDTGYAGVKEYKIFTRKNSKGQTLEDARCSIILGKNGSGKSTIARAFNDNDGEVEFFDNGGNSLGKACSNVYVFDESFIIENFRVHGGDTLNPVILLGDTNQRMERIKNLEVEKSEIQRKMDELVNEGFDKVLREWGINSDISTIPVIDKEIDGISVRRYILAFFENALRNEKTGPSDLNLLCKINKKGSFDEKNYCRWVALGFEQACAAAKEPIVYRGFEEYSAEALVEKQMALMGRIKSLYDPSIDKPSEQRSIYNDAHSDLIKMRQEFATSFLALFRYEWQNLLEIFASGENSFSHIIWYKRSRMYKYKIDLAEKERLLERESKSLYRETHRNSSKNITKYINDLLSLVFGNDGISLKANKDFGYHIENRVGLVPRNRLSVGEQNVVSLCYFFAKLAENKKLENSMRENQIVVLDDPISSFDDDNKYGVTVLLAYLFKSILADKSESKLIILTHDSSFAFNMKKVINGMYSDRLSCLNMEENRLRETDFSTVDMYSSILNKMYKFSVSRMTGKKVSISDVPSANEVRRVWEAFLSFELGETSISGMSIAKDMGEILKEKGKSSKFIDVFIPQIFINIDSHSKDQILGGNLYLAPVLRGRQYEEFVQHIICFIHLVAPHHIAWRIRKNYENKKFKPKECVKDLDSLVENVLRRYNVHP